MTGRIIAIDWGTTNFRAWLIEADGAVLDEIPEGKGLRALTPAEFPSYCQSRVGEWRGTDTDIPIYMAGMVGSPQGWRTAPQLPLPLHLDQLAAAVIPVADVANAWIVPGARFDEGGRIDLMRGEESQIFGALALAGRPAGTFCLPGTHSKWAVVERERLVAFATSMTGEVYDALLEHTILGRPAERGATFCVDAFDRGMARASESGGLLHHLFSARSLHLYGRLAASEIPAYLSGITIGHEIQAMRALRPAVSAVFLVSSPALRVSYERALHGSGLDVHWIDGRSAMRAGIAAVVRRHRPTG